VFTVLIMFTVFEHPLIICKNRREVAIDAISTDPFARAAIQSIKSHYIFMTFIKIKVYDLSPSVHMCPHETPPPPVNVHMPSILNTHRPSYLVRASTMTFWA